MRFIRRIVFKSDMWEEQLPRVILNSVGDIQDK